MGVRGLARFCSQNDARTSRAVASLRDVTLAVDFVGFQFFVCEQIAKQLEREGHMPSALWLLLGGCPIRLEQYVDHWLKQLAQANVSLVFVSDPPQCFLGVGHNKTLELQERAQQKITKLRELRSHLFASPVKNESAVKNAPITARATMVSLKTDKKDQMRNYLQEAQSCFPFSREKLRSVLKRHGARVITATKEADEVLAQLVRDGEAYAVVANDSDFLVMQGVQYIPFSKLRVDGGSVSARVFTPELVAQALEITPAQLVDLALLCTNDFTAQLDVQFQFAQVLNFPRGASNRSSDDVISPELASLWIRSQPTASMLDQPGVEALYAQYGAAFSDTLGAIYSFYGYESAFRQRYPLQLVSDRAMPANEMQAYIKLLDQHDYSSSLIDVLYSKSRRLKQQFDIVAAMVGPFHKGKNMLQLLAPARSILYQAMGVPSVREAYYDPMTGHHKQYDVAMPTLEAVQSFLASAAIAHRSQAGVEKAWRALVFKCVFDNQAGLENAAFLWKFLGKQSSVFKSVVSALVLLWKCDVTYLPSDSRVVTMERLEILLLTTFICASLKEDVTPPSYDFEESDLEIDWQVYASVGGFVEILRVLHFARVALGEKVPPSSAGGSCPSIFSAEVFLPVYAIVSSTRAANAPTAVDPAEGRALTRAQVDSVLCYYVSDMRDDARAKKWDQFCQMRAVLNRLVELVPVNAEAEENEPESVAPVVTPKVVTKPTLLLPAAVSKAAARAAANGNSTPSSVSSKGKKKTPKGKAAKAKAAAAAAANGGKIVSASEVSVVNPLDPSASEFIASPRPLAGPPPAVLPSPPSHDGLNREQRRAQRKAQQVHLTPREQNNDAPKGNKKSGKAPLLTPASVAKRLGKTFVPKNKPSPPQNATYASGSATGEYPAPPLPQEPEVEHNSSLRGLLQRLPVYNHRHEILKNVASNQLTIIQGETGCGKSTSVPQFILDQWLRDSTGARPVNIYVTQPRRIAAIELAKTVAGMREENEFGEDGEVGKTIGYRIGQKHCTSDKTKITYVTTGYMVERLIHDTEALKTMTHLVIDEVHERSMDVDTLLLLLKLQLQNHEHLRVVIMSATMDAKILIKYLAKSVATKLLSRKPLFVGTKLFAVENVFVDDIGTLYPNLLHSNHNDFMRIDTELRKVTNKRASANSELGQQIIHNVHEAQLKIIPAFIQQLIVEHHHYRNIGAVPQCILIFLPGIGGINRLYEELGSLFQDSWQGVAVAVTVLHSTLELEQQQVAFATIGGKSTKIVLSTNIAESSVTIPDVTHVINCGMEKQIQMPNARQSHAEVLVDVWCSRASVLQRSGRAGRLRAGVAFHLFSNEFMTSCMPEFTTPEILRKPLDRIVLQLKGKLHEFGVPSDLLKQALDAPDLNHIDGAYKLLAHYDAIDSEDEESARITAFGSFVCHMPLSMELCRLILMGKNIVGPASSPKTRAYLLANTVILVSILASQDLFVMPSWFHLQTPSRYMDEMKLNLKAKLTVDGGSWSEPISLWKLYISLLAEHTLTRRPHVPSKLKKLSISVRRYQALNLLISDTCERLVSLARQGHVELDPAMIQMLLRLDNYASSQRVDKDLLQFASASLAQDNHDVDVLRFLVVHNYADHLIGGRLTEGSHFDDDDDDVIDATDRVDLGIGKEDGRTFFALSNDERKQLLGRLSAGSSQDEFTNIAYSANEVSLYSKAVVATQESGDATSSSEGTFDKVIPRMSFPVSLVYYIRDQKFPVDFGLMNPDTGKEEKIRFRVSDSSGSNIVWSQAKDGVRVNIGGRSLFALPVRCPSTTTLRAVYTDRLFTGDETRMFCSKCTLLPPDAVAYHAIVLLATVRQNANVWIQVDRQSQDIVAVKIDQQLVAMPAKTALRREAVTLVNAVREGFSLALQCAPTLKPEERDLLLPVETITSVCRDDRVLVRLTKEEAKGRQYEWQQLTMEIPSAATRTALREDGRTPPRFPAFQ